MPLSGVGNLKLERVQTWCHELAWKGRRAELLPWKQVGQLLNAQAHKVFIPGAANRVQPYDSHFPRAPWWPHEEGHPVRRARTT